MFLPKIGEVIAIRFLQDLFGPGLEFIAIYSFMLFIVMNDHFTCLPLKIHGLLCHQPTGCLPNPTIMSDFISLLRIPHNYIPRSRHHECFEPLACVEIKRLMRYCNLYSLPVLSSSRTRPNVPPTAHDSSPTYPPSGSNDGGGLDWIKLFMQTTLANTLSLMIVVIIMTTTVIGNKDLITYAR